MTLAGRKRVHAADARRVFLVLALALALTFAAGAGAVDPPTPPAADSTVTPTVVSPPPAPAATGADPLQEIVVEAPEPRYVSPTRRDRIGRIWAPVYINARGPFRLVLDTGASNSAINADVATALGLPLTSDHRMLLRGVTGAAVVPTVPIDSLVVGDLELSSRRLPIIIDALGGAEGVLGTEGLMDKRIFIDFRKDRITIFKSHKETAPFDFVVVPFRLEHGLLVVPDARIGTVPVNAVFDTGGQATIGNVALREALLRHYRERNSTPDEITGATLDVQKGNRIAAPPIVLGDLQMRDVQVTIGDMYIFEHWHMTAEPTIMIGMDLIGLLDTVVIDYRLRQLQIKLKR